MPADGGGIEEAPVPGPRDQAAGRGVFDVVEAGSRVFLRRPGEADRDEFLAMVQASRQLHAQWIHPPGRARDYEAFLVRSRHRGLQVGKPSGVLRRHDTRETRWQSLK